MKKLITILLGICKYEIEQLSQQQRQILQSWPIVDTAELTKSRAGQELVASSARKSIKKHADKAI